MRPPWRGPAALGVAAVTLAPACAPDPAGAPPTCVLVVVDTLRRDALSCYGGPAGATPAVDGFARGGVRFEQAIASSCWTLPSVASLLTGAWPEIHKAVGQRTLLSPVSPEVPLLAERFRDAGYDTVAVVNAAFLSPALGLGRGFDVYDHEHAYNRTVRRAGDTVDAALAHTEVRAGRPLFLLVHLFDPHLDYDAPGELGARFGADPAGPGPPLSRKAALALAEDGVATGERRHVRALYQAEVALVDRAVGRLVAGLRALGRWEQATVALVSDHGEELWDHGGFEHGHALYDELIRVPLVLKPPAAVPVARAVVDAQVRTIDLAATLLELYGLTPPATCAGRSLLPLVTGAPDPPRPAFAQDTLYGTDQLSWRDARHHLIYDRGAGVAQRVELYDWREDPLEQRDLADEQPDLAESLRAELARFYAELRERAAAIADTERMDLGPSRRDELLKSLESLGYAGEER